MGNTWDYVTLLLARAKHEQAFYSAVQAKRNTPLQLSFDDLNYNIFIELIDIIDLIERY